MPSWRNFVRRTTAIGVSSLVMAPFCLGAGANASPSYTMEERAAAISTPSLVYIETKVKGFVRNKQTGETLHSVPMTVTFRCSGFGVAAGHVLTTTQCVQPSLDTIRDRAVHLVANGRVNVGLLTPDQRVAFITETIGTSTFSGSEPNSLPALNVFGQLFVGQAELIDSPAAKAEILNVQPVSEGNVAVLKLALPSLPIVEISPDTPAVDTPVMIAGFESDIGSSASVLTVRFKAAKVAGIAGTKIPSMFQLDQDLGAVTRGGLVTDTAGRVMGMITSDAGSPESGNRLVTHGEHLKQAMSTANIKGSLAEADLAYRAGLDNYFAGRYTEAIRKFDSVAASIPNHAVASTYRKNAVDRLTIEGERGSSTETPWIMILLTALLLTSLVAIGWLVAERRRRAKPSPLDPFLPTSAMPYSAQPYSAQPYSGQPYSAQPYSAQPYSAQPYSGQPYSSTGQTFPAEPTSAQPYSPPQAYAPQQPMVAGDDDNPWAPQPKPPGSQ